MRGLGECVRRLEATSDTQLKALRKETPEGKSSLPLKHCVPRLAESPAVHCARLSLLSSGDRTELGDDDPAVARIMERLPVARSGIPRVRQDKEAWSEGGTPYQ
ncbi:MAG: hypothetical protein AM324_002880 [Candidatus Thorarchaeota archaeon SMTZ1-83]|nr:MAG: hypothetical protein AM324_03895 [Candidatus Thorarchaeota archaeon SMTZ1-83]